MRTCPLVNVCLRAHAREADTLARLEASDTPAPHTSARTSPAHDSVLVLRELIERMQAEIKFSQIKIEALNFEIARLKRWRFGSSAESLEGSTQAVLFDAILMDTAAEDAAAEDAAAHPPNRPQRPAAGPPLSPCHRPTSCATAKAPLTACVTSNPKNCSGVSCERSPPQTPAPARPPAPTRPSRW